MVTLRGLTCQGFLGLVLTPSLISLIVVSFFWLTGVPIGSLFLNVEFYKWCITIATVSWTKTLNTKGQYFRKFIQSLKSNTGSVCRNNKNSCHRNSWSQLGTLCFWSHDFTFLSTIIEWESIVCKKPRAEINIISDIDKILKWLPVVYDRMKKQQIR